jgi:tRNA threonylcarbamoyladenosine dehydratase
MNEDYLQRFGGLARLYGAAALPRLHAAHVCIVGVGGVGSWVVEGLARSGVGALTLIDLDDVCLTNVNRQLPALDGNIGRPKVDALAERVKLINPDCTVTAVGEYFTARTADQLLAKRHDWVVDCIDLMSNKALLIAECTRRGQPVLTVGSAGGKRDATRIRVHDFGDAHGDELLRQVRKKLRRDHGFAKGEGNTYGIPCVSSQEKPVYPWADGTCATEPEEGSNLRLDCATGFGTGVFITGAFGFAAAGELVRRIAAGAVAPNGPGA